MPSSYTTSARFTLQATGENNNTWGVILNSGVFQLVDDNINGRLAFALSGAKALTSVLGATDEARMAFLDVTGGTGGTVTIPAVPKGYFVRNGAAGNVTISAGGATNAIFTPGDAGPLFSSGSAVYPTMIGGKTVKKYVDDLFSSVPVALPPVAGQAGKFLGNDGVNTLAWQTATTLRWSFGGVTSSASVLVNLGPTAPPAPIDAGVALQLTGATGTGVRLEMNSFASAVQYNARRANGTAAAPTALVANDPMVVLGARGYGATGYAITNRAAINLTAGENWTDAAQGARIDFVTTPNGGVVSALRWSLVDAGHLIPATANTYDLGSNAAPLRGVYGGTLTATGGNVFIDGAVGTARGVSIYTAGSLRWQAVGSIDAESGANAGTNFQLARYSDTGVFLGYALIAARATGLINFPGGVPLGPGGVPLASSRLTPLALAAAAFVGAITSNSLVALNVGAQLRCHTNVSAPVVDGHLVMAINSSGAPITITQDAGASLLWVNPAGAALNGNRQLATAGLVTIVALNGGWLINGTGIT